MSGATREIRLTRGTNRLSSKETYVARLAQRCTLGYDEVLDEVIERGFLNISKPMLKMILEHTFDTMITNTLKDGNSRRLGDYFVLQMEVKGAFDDPGEQFDAEKHRLALKLRPLKALKRKPGRDDIKVYNRNAGPKVVINRLFSASTPENDTLVFGDDIVLEGENLFLIDDAAEVQDSIAIGYRSQHLHGLIRTEASGFDGIVVSDDGRRMTIPWRPTIGEVIKANWDIADPEKNPPVAIMVALRSRGGVASAKQQLHRARAMFDTWHAKYPDYSLDGMSWRGL